MSRQSGRGQDRAVIGKESGRGAGSRRYEQTVREGGRAAPLCADSQGGGQGRAAMSKQSERG